MKNLSIKCTVLILLLTLFSGIDSLSQVPGDSTGKWIKEINEQSAIINQDSAKMNAVQKNIFGYSSEGGSLEKFSEGTILRKAILSLYGENGKSTGEYYFMNGELILLVEKEVKYKSPIYTGKVEIKSQEENRYYFKNKSLVYWIGSDGKIKESSLYPDKEEELLKDLELIL